MRVKNNDWLRQSVIVFFIVLQGCENNIEKVNSITSNNQQKAPVESSQNAEILYSDSAHVKVKLNANQIDRYIGTEKPYFEMPKGVHMFFYKKYPIVETDLKADYAIGYDNVNGIDRMEAKRNVVVINEKGEKLTTEHLIWDAMKKKIYTNEFVKITTKDEVIWGNGLEADENFTHYEIKEPVGQINIKDTIQ